MSSSSLWCMRCIFTHLVMIICWLGILILTLLPSILDVEGGRDRTVYIPLVFALPWSHYYLSPERYFGDKLVKVITEPAKLRERRSGRHIYPIGVMMLTMAMPAHTGAGLAIYEMHCMIAMVNYIINSHYIKMTLRGNYVVPFSLHQETWTTNGIELSIIERQLYCTLALNLWEFEKELSCIIFL